MTKKQLQVRSKIQMALIFGLGVLTVGAAGAAAYSGATKYVAERDVIVYEAGGDAGEELGAIKPVRTPWNFTDGVYVNGSEVLDTSGNMSVEGTLTATGGATSLATTTVGAQDFTVDSGLFFADASANQVMVNTTTAAGTMTVSNGAVTTTIAIGDSSASNVPALACFWNGSEYTISYYNGSTTTPTLSTSTACSI